MASQRTRATRGQLPRRNGVERTVLRILETNPEIVKDEVELFKMVRVEAKNSDYRPVIPPAQIRAILGK